MVSLWLNSLFLSQAVFNIIFLAMFAFIVVVGVVAAISFLGGLSVYSSSLVISLGYFFGVVSVLSFLFGQKVYLLTMGAQYDSSGKVTVYTTNKVASVVQSQISVLKPTYSTMNASIPKLRRGSKISNIKVCRAELQKCESFFAMAQNELTLAMKEVENWERLLAACQNPQSVRKFGTSMRFSGGMSSRRIMSKKSKIESSADSSSDNSAQPSLKESQKLDVGNTGGKRDRTSGRLRNVSACKYPREYDNSPNLTQNF